MFLISNAKQKIDINLRYEIIKQIHLKIQSNVATSGHGYYNEI